MNPLMNQLPAQQPAINPAVIQSVKRMMNMLQAAQNPEAAINMLAQNNPMMAQVIQLCQGKDPKEVFYNMCHQQGVNPDYILNQLK